MPKICLIAAVDEKNGIGKDNNLLCHLPADLNHFKLITMGKPIIMGRKTFQSIGKPLPGRLNVVISKCMNPQEGVEVVDSLDKAIAICSNYPEVMIIGGETIYKQSISLSSTLYITIIHHEFDADVFFPEMDTEEWECTRQEIRPKDSKNNFDLTFCRYDRVNSFS